MERDYLDIIKEKQFIELNSAERAEVSEICATEEEFNATKAMLLQMDGIVIEPITPEPKTKESLDSLFDQTYPKAAPIWYNSVFTVIIPKEKPIYRQPLVQIAAAFLIFWMVFPFFNTTLVADKTQLAKVEVQKEEEQAIIKEQEASGTVSETVQQEVNSTPAITNQQERLNPQDDVLRATTRSFAERSAASGVEGIASAAMLAEEEVMDLEISTHPDGVFMDSNHQSIAFGQSASESLDLLDLLTATF